MDAILGEIRAFAGTYAPENWAFCDGSLQQISQNEQLFALIGNVYGGDGVNTFALPNLQGRIVVGTGQLQGGNNYPIGNSGGVEEVILVTGNLPAHQHTMVASNIQATTNVPAGNMLAATYDAGNPTFPVLTYLPNDTTDPNLVQVPLNNNTLSMSGGQPILPHENRQPYLTISYIICTVGLYPQFN